MIRASLAPLPVALIQQVDQLAGDLRRGASACQTPSELGKFLEAYSRSCQLVADRCHAEATLLSGGELSPGYVKELHDVLERAL